MDFPPNLHILHGHAGRGGPRLKRSFVSPAQLHLHTFHRLSPGLGTPLHPLSPPLSSLHWGFVPWRRGEYTFDKHHISGTAVCAHVWLHHRKKEKREKKKKSPFLSQNHGNLLIRVRADGFPIGCAEAACMCAAEPPARLALLSLQRGARKSRCGDKHVAAMQSKTSSTKALWLIKSSTRQGVTARAQSSSFTPLDFPGSS